jgi:2-aminoadipate transaminase
VAADWDALFAKRTERMRSSDIREILKVTARPNIISLAGGLPAPELFPVDQYREAFDKVLREHGAQALQYSVTEGYAPLRELLAERLHGFGISCTADDILITNGSQQALDLISKIFINPGDNVAVENPSYLGALQAFDSYEAQYVLVPMDEDGMRTDLLDDILTKNDVKFIYALPNFQNPSGRSMTLERRKQLVEVAQKHGVPIVEDDPYGELRYEGDALPSLKALDTTDSVIYLGTFSKILAPGFRLGWIVATNNTLYEQLVQAKQPADLHSASAPQMATYEVARDGFIDQHVQKIVATYKERRTAILDAMETHFPEGARWTRADGGLFVWVMLPESIDTRDLLAEAIEHDNVAFVPGQSFHADKGGRNTLRLNFSMMPPDRIEEGIKRLGRAIERRLAADEK